jgi:hypothetical protein
MKITEDSVPLCGTAEQVISTGETLTRVLVEKRKESVGSRAMVDL